MYAFSLDDNYFKGSITALYLKFLEQIQTYVILLLLALLDFHV
jgi:hypothetical protein